MIIRIARKEFIEMLRDGRFRWAGALVFSLLLTALVLGWQHHRDIKRQHDLAQAETRDQWLKQPAKNPHSAAHYGIYAFKPKLLPGLLDRGVDPYTGVAVWLEAHKQNEFKFRPAQDGTAVQRFGELTAATVLQLLLPLLIILLSFAAFAGEREQGTLRQLLSLGVPVKALAWGKALGIAGALCVLIVPAALLGVVALALTSENGMLEASAARLGWMLASYLLYFGIFIGFSLAVSARARSAQFALLALLAGWIINGLIAPRALADLARVAFPTPSAFAFQQAIDRDMKGDGHDLNEALKRRVLAEYKVSRVEELPVNFAGLSLQESEVHGNAIFDRHFSVLWNTYEQQDRLKQTAGIMAPMLAISSLSRGLAGTDFAQHRDFAQAAEQYRRLFIKQMNDDMTYHAGKQDFTYLAHPAVWASVPDFKYEAPATSWVLRQQRISLALLALWFMAAVFIALLATRRMRIV